MIVSNITTIAEDDFKDYIVLGWDSSKKYFLTAIAYHPTDYTINVRIDCFTPKSAFVGTELSVSGSGKITGTSKDTYDQTITYDIPLVIGSGSGNTVAYYNGALAKSTELTNTGTVTYNLTLSDGSTSNTFSGTFKLKDIPEYTGTRRWVTEFTVNGATITSINFGDSVAIDFTPITKHMYYRLRMRFQSPGESDGLVVLANNIAYGGTHFNVQTTLNMIRYMNNTITSGTATVALETYMGETNGDSVIERYFLVANYLGADYITFNVPSSVVPTIDSITLKEGNSRVPASFYNAGVYVQYNSRLRVAIVATGLYGATISKYYTTVNSKGYNYSSFTSDILSRTGNLIVSIRVTDSRGRVSTASRTIRVIGYTMPTLSDAPLFRCHALDDPTAEQDGAFVAVYPKGSVNPLTVDGNSLNSVTLSVSYKRTTDTAYSSIQVQCNDFTLDTEYGIFSADIGSAYDVFVTLTDAFGNGDTFYCSPIAATGALIEIGKNRRSIAFFQRIPGTQQGFFISNDVYITGKTHENAVLETADASGQLRNVAPSQYTISGNATGRYIPISTYHVRSIYLTVCVDTDTMKMGTYKYDVDAQTGEFTAF